jgi:site-specific DNA-methyltransferase (adenine-specific)
MSVKQRVPARSKNVSAAGASPSAARMSSAKVSAMDSSVQAELWRAPTASSRAAPLPDPDEQEAKTPRWALGSSDAVEWLGTLEAESVDLVITDPPYESLEKHRAIGTTTRLKHSKASSNDWFQIFPNRRFPELFDALYRVLKRNTHFYLFCDQETTFLVKPLAEAAGFRFWKPIVWDKRKIGMGYHYRSRYEFILFFEKGKRKLNDLGVPDIIECPRVAKGYPTEKPAAVSEVLIRQSSLPGQRVIDPFLGSGSVGVAALGLARSFMGTDICDAARKLSSERLGSCVWGQSVESR